MRKGKFFVLLLAFLILAGAGMAFAQSFEYGASKPHKGGDVSPTLAYIMIEKNPARSFLVDVRTQPEYQFVGHAEGAYNIPFRFWSKILDDKGYTETANPDFGKDLLARFNPRTDTLFFICRSGGRSAAAAEEAVKAGWPEEKVYSVMGGFEGDKVTFRKSAFYGQRKLGGWRNEGLPWTYDMDRKLVYQRDIAP
jgi:rhodanese-related sulfurtransferase